MVIGVTGGVGAGKSTILQYLREAYHAAVIMADDVAKDLMEPGQAAYGPVVRFFGPQILVPGGQDERPIDRARLSGIVFRDPEKLKALNAIVHPLVREEIVSLIKAYDEQGYAIIVIESAILIQAGYRDMLDELWVVHTDIEIRYQRLMSSRGYTMEKIQSIMSNQLPDEEMESMADYVIDNSGSPESVWAQISERLSSREDQCRQSK